MYTKLGKLPVLKRPTSLRFSLPMFTYETMFTYVYKVRQVTSVGESLDYNERYNIHNVIKKELLLSYD